MQNVCDLFNPDIVKHNLIAEFDCFYNIDFRNGYTMQIHQHPRIEIMYVRKGNCSIILEDHTYKMEPGDFILINGDIAHRLSVDDKIPCKILCLEFSFRHKEGVLGALGHAFAQIAEVRYFFESATPILKMKDTVEIYALLMAIYRELEQKLQGLTPVIEMSFCHFLIKLSRLFQASTTNGAKPNEAYVRESITYMSDNLYDDLPVERIARHVNLNVSYFYKIFKRITGETPVDYLNNMRIEKAKMLLETTEIPIIELCSYIGFNSRQYFTQVFKKITGTTPSKYKRTLESNRMP